MNKHSKFRLVQGFDSIVTLRFVIYDVLTLLVMSFFLSNLLMIKKSFALDSDCP